MNSFWAGKTLMYICNNSPLLGAARNKYFRERERVQKFLNTACLILKIPLASERMKKQFLFFPW